MRVLFVTTSYPADDSDPRGIHVHRLARSLATEGVEVRVVAPGTKQYAVTRLDGVAIDRRTYWFGSGQRLAEGLGGIMPNIRSRPWLAAQVPPLIAALYRGVRANCDWADVVHAHWLYPAGLVATLAGHRQPLVVTSHGGDLNRIRSRGLSHRAVTRVFSRSQRILGVSRALADRLVDLGSSPAKTSFQPLGVDLTPGEPDSVDWPQMEGALRIAFVGSLIPRKGPEVLISAASELARLGTKASIAFVGSGPMLSDLEDMTRLRAIDARFLGNVAPTSVRDWLDAAQVLCLPSRSEGRPLAVMEAMAAGIPVVASDIEGVRELVTPETGILVEAGDTAGLAEALHGLAIDPARRIALGATGRKRIVELGLTNSAVARSHIEVYEAAIEGWRA